MNPVIRTTYETPSPVHPRVTIMSYQELFDMTERLAARRNALLEQYRRMDPEAQANVREELAELGEAMTQDGSVTDMESQLKDSGHGSAGIL